VPLIIVSLPAAVTANGRAARPLQEVRQLACFGWQVASLPRQTWQVVFLTEPVRAPDGKGLAKVGWAFSFVANSLATPHEHAPQFQ
jgi:hypothetical protein